MKEAPPGASRVKVMDGSELPADVQSRHDILKVEGKQSQQDHSELPETIEDVEPQLDFQIF